MSTYVYVLNNPVSQIDPDGRVVPLVAALIGAGISALTYTASVAMSEGGFNNWNWGSFAKSVGIGALSGAITAGIGSAYGEGVGNFGTELHRAFTHASVQATIAHYTGGDVKSSFLSGFLGSGIGSATGNLSNVAQMGISAVSGAGISTAIGGGNFWENLAISGIVVGANHMIHQIAKRPNLGKLGNYIRDEYLDSDFEKRMFERFWQGKGDYTLTKEEFENMYSQAKPDGTKTVIDANLESYSQVHSLYSSTEFNLAIGRGTFSIDTWGAYAFKDYYDFDTKNWGIRSYKNELKTRAINYSAPTSAKPFNITYPKK